MSAIDGITPRINEFQLFGVLSVGAFFVISLIPLVPRAYLSLTAAEIGIFVVLSYMLGQTAYELMYFPNEYLPLTSHRKMFVRELNDPEQVDPVLIERTKSICSERLLGAAGDHSEPDPDPDSDGKADADKNAIDTALSGEMMYPLVVESIRTNGGGFSMTLNSMYEFFRSGLVVIIVLMVIYTVEFVAGPGLVSVPDSSYVDFYDNFEEFYYVFITILTFLLLVFYRGYRTNMRIYIEYLFSDFIILNSTLDAE